MEIEPIPQELQQRLPSPKGVALAIMQACSRDDVSMTEVARLVQSDPALTGRLLEQANSAAFAGRPAVSLTDAVNRLGLQTVRQLALSFSLIDQYAQGACKAFDYAAFWSQSLLMAVSLRELGSGLRYAALDEMFTCGLLAQVGRLALATAYPVEYSRLLDAGVSGPDLLVAERQLLQTDHLHMSVALLAQWGVPLPLIEPMLFQEDPDTCGSPKESRTWQLSHLLHLSVRLAQFLMAPNVDRAYQTSELALQASAFGIDAAALAQWVDSSVGQWRVWGEKLSVDVKELPGFDKLAEASVSPDQEPEAARLRILVVEDDPIVRTLLDKWLREECHHTVALAGDGKQGLQLALEFKPQVILTDWLMPVMDGLAFCRALRASDWGQNIYVLMLTSVESEAKLVTAFDAGVDDFLTKPVNTRALGARLKAAWRYVRLRDAWERDHDRLTRTAAELALSNRRLQQAAMTDPLTELGNRRAGLAALTQVWSAAQRYGRALSVLSIDVDHFKSINDRYGHAAGDAVLQGLGKSLREASRKEDTVCRWGGEEFLIISPNMSLPEGIQAAERIRARISALAIPAGDKTIRVTVSLGIAPWSSDMTKVEQLLAEVDRALYAAKRGGRNRVAVCERGKVRLLDPV